MLCDKHLPTEKLFIQMWDSDLCKIVYRATLLRRVMTFSANQRAQKASWVETHAYTFPPLQDCSFHLRDDWLIWLAESFEIKQSWQLCLLSSFVIQINPSVFGSRYAHLNQSLAILLNYYSLQGCSQALQDFAKSKMAVIGGIGVGIAILQVIFYITKINWLIIIKLWL